MRDDPLLRLEKRARRLPPGTRCSVCGREDQLVPVRGSDDPVLCQDHDRQRRGTSPFDVGHVARRRSWSSLTVLMPASANQRIEDMRRDLDLTDTPDPQGNPLLIQADYLEGRALLDLLQANYLRTLDAHLRTEHGDGYWRGGPGPPII